MSEVPAGRLGQEGLGCLVQVDPEKFGNAVHAGVTGEEGCAGQSRDGGDHPAGVTPARRQVR